MSALKAANLGLRFLLELCALVAVGYWGFTVGKGTLAKVVLGIGGPLVITVIWARFLAPKSSMRATGLLYILLEVLVFGVAALALAGAGRPRLAVVFVVVVVINAVLIAVWDQ